MATTRWDALLADFRSATFSELRPRQRAILNAYDEATGSDIAMELPTGGGKTLVGLLIAEHHLQRGERVAYLTGNNHLSDQVVEEAQLLPDFAVARFSGGNYPPSALAAYNIADSLGVMNYWVYFNSSPRVEPADVVIFDDAHLAEQPIAGMFAIRVGARQQPYLFDAICDLVLAHSDLYPSIELMRDRSAGPTTAPELLAFSDLRAIARPLVELLAQHLPEQDRRFVLPQIRPALSACGLLIGPAAIELRPYTPPTSTLSYVTQSKRRIYMSATLGTMDDLQRRLGVNAPARLLDEDPDQERIGDRMFIVNPTDAAALDHEPLGFVLRQAERAGRVAWLCASHDEADRVEVALQALNYSTYRLRSGLDDTSLTRWSGDSHGHLVTAGRFDGMDFADDLCRLVVLPSLPAASTEFERFVMAYLGDATYMRHRVGQRVTQALGRANRSSSDWAMYIAAGPEFSTMLAASAVQAEIPKAVRGEIVTALGRVDGTWDQAIIDADQFWNRHTAAGPQTTLAQPSSLEPASTLRRPRPGRAASTAAFSGSASDEVAAVTHMWLGDYVTAAEHATTAAETLATVGQVEHAAFWRYVAAQAAWEGGSRGAAIGSLRAAVSQTQNTAWFVRLRRVLASLTSELQRASDEQPWANWDEWLRDSGPVKARRSIDRVAASWSGTHDQQAEALETLGRVAGVAASRPTGNAVTDATWAFLSGTTLHKRLWEVKTGNPVRVPRDWVDQNVGQVSAARSQNVRARVSGCILTHLTEAEVEAADAARDTSTFVTVEAMETLTAELAALFRDYIQRWGEGSVDERSAARDAVESRLPQPGWVQQLFAPGTWVTRDRVRACFES